jgi:hypothetical protein
MDRRRGARGGTRGARPARRRLPGAHLPAGAPLPGRGDPLAGFDTAGPLRPIRERLFLLRNNLIAWVVPGIVAFIGFLASIFYAQGLLGLLGTFLLFGSLVAAGWVGWQRPTLFGTAASLVGYLFSVGLILYTFASQGAGPDTFETTPGQLAVRLVSDGLIQAGLGFLGGWYGGYLRRRQAQIAGQTRTRR